MDHRQVDVVGRGGGDQATGRRGEIPLGLADKALRRRKEERLRYPDGSKGARHASAGLVGVWRGWVGNRGVHGANIPGGEGGVVWFDAAREVRRLAPRGTVPRGPE